MAEREIVRTLAADGGDNFGVRVRRFGEGVAETPVSALFIARWAPRALTGEPIPDDVLFALLEAARFAPSSMNARPWRLVYVRQGEPKFDALPMAMVAVGRRGPAELAPEPRRALEKPKQRRTLDQIAFAGAFPDEV